MDYNIVDLKVYHISAVINAVLRTNSHRVLSTERIIVIFIIRVDTAHYSISNDIICADKPHYSISNDIIRADKPHYSISNEW